MSDPIVRRILITNDDGINAPGLAILERIARNLAEEVWVVAPEHDRSGAGQSISIHTPLRCYAQGDSGRRFALSGTPADCVLFAQAEWFGETLPDLVLSGVNCGANISDSVQYSGTVGAVLTAEHLGIPAMALSQAFLNREGIDWSPVTELGEQVIRSLWKPEAQPTCCWNINFPACAASEVKDLRWARQSSGSIQRTRLLAGQDGRSLPYWWLSFERSSKHIVAPDMDVTVMRDNAVAVTPLRSMAPLPNGEASCIIENE
ncbi:5'/3'-nucleotidase SurE [Marinobacter nanhaiticus D15-8W]|uniref:5'-nucleotidase SurE n=1 Tax=Marinobacter nanhaiticus D15-8W TaxID=626887 RepID=N6W430_9GAMM|nr:5'/3'-nucleotidase SurE [Marinobacter nanhaiticus]ENO14909.1 5'/3'-nucleotidase SurE [Marinobacter nanhaiticus D15-8W]BES69395.1 5'/3'-nucleotidase SurE [Marinobacter nanhaiticus D15-8W]